MGKTSPTRVAGGIDRLAEQADMLRAAVRAGDGDASLVLVQTLHNLALALDAAGRSKEAGGVWAEARAHSDRLTKGEQP